MEQYVIFQSNHQRFAIVVQNVARVIEAKQFIALPEVAPYILGVYEFQEKMVPIVDVRKKLFQKFTESTGETKVILCRWKDQTLGLYVEDILGISSLEPAVYEENSLNTSIKQIYIQSFLKMDDTLVMLLDLSYFFSAKQEQALVTQLENIKDDMHGEC